MFLIFVFYHLMLSGNFYGWQIRHEIFWELNFGPGIFCAFDFCPHSIIPVTLTEIRAFHNLLEIFQKVSRNLKKICSKFAKKTIKSCFL